MLSKLPDLPFGGKRNQDNSVKLINSLVSEKNMAASTQYRPPPLPQPAPSDWRPTVPSFHEIWQRFGLARSRLSFKIKEQRGNAPTLTQIAANPCTSYGERSNYNRNLVIHTEKTLTSKKTEENEIPKRSNYNTLYRCSIINVLASTHIFLNICMLTDTQTYT